jgi:hypothetical protein
MKEMKSLYSSNLSQPNTKDKNNCQSLFEFCPPLFIALRRPRSQDDWLPGLNQSTGEELRGVQIFLSRLFLPISKNP